ncbi:phosphatidylglycerophosphatase A [Nicoletella semolina]|uniref:Phosphatidylglycerophosphatase A n=1 Tax=Nicoletella semolina TaxID=271160 RepID=A0A4R2NBX5_9PAST|nr:phosphatidylglycerophosphatase A [Nicoletella semolina]MDH2925057.1 phosphatidylglycerophosphatase [Nicoletella semolina]TCP18607.1 phosphatidylglycerophosphatase A [Nicoletella semolina]
MNLKNPYHFLACGFGAGLIKPASGTWGSLVGVLLAILLWKLTASTWFFVLLTALSFLFGCYICQKVSDDINSYDDGRIVWDEIVAIFLIFSFLPEHSGLFYLLTFIFFRLFDIAKPFPIRRADLSLKGGFGIMFDDILAGIYTLFSLYLITWLI